jgi:hypothetical protein
MGERKLPEIETHGIVLPATSRNSGAEREQQSSRASATAPELNARFVPPTHTAVDFGSSGPGASAGHDPLFPSPRNHRKVGRTALSRVYFGARKSIPISPNDHPPRNLCCEGVPSRQARGRTTTSVMISEVLFGYFLFKEKVTYASALDKVASLFHLNKPSIFCRKVKELT